MNTTVNPIVTFAKNTNDEVVAVSNNLAAYTAPDTVLEYVEKALALPGETGDAPEWTKALENAADHKVYYALYPGCTEPMRIILTKDVNRTLLETTDHRALVVVPEIEDVVYATKAEAQRVFDDRILTNMNANLDEMIAYRHFLKDQLRSLNEEIDEAIKERNEFSANMNR